MNEMRWHVALLAVLACPAAVVAAGNQAADLTNATLASAAPVYRWIAQEKVRGVYCSGLAETRYYQAMAAAGLNCVLNKTTGFDPHAPEAGVAFHVEQATRAAACGLRYTAYINFNSDAERAFTRRQYTPLVDAKGTAYPQTPSPLDREFWNQAIKQRWLQLAEAAKTAPIVAGEIDFEMYGSEVLFYDRVGCLDYSDLAFNGFLREAGLAQEAAVPPAERERWLAGRNLSDAYMAYYRRTLEAICRDIEQAVHQVNPDFIIGFYSWSPHSPFYEACARGLGTERMPVLLWPGTTYTDGYSTAGVDDQVLALQKLAAHAVFIPGLWLWQFHPDNLSATAYECAAHSGGYWLYGIYCMWPETAERRKVIHVKDELYWASLTQANREIGALPADPAHRTTLRFDPERSVYTGVDPLTVCKPVALRPASAGGAPVTPLDKQPPAPPVRTLGCYRAWAQAGETLTFRVHSLRMGPSTHGTTASLIGPDWHLLQQEEIGVGATRDVTLTAPETGVYTLVTQSGTLPAAVTCNATHFVLDATRGVGFMTGLRPLYLTVPTGVTQFTLTGEGQGIEQFNLKVISPDGQVRLTREDISTRTTMRVAVPAGQDGQPWLLELAAPTTGVLEDAKLALSDNLPPYLSPAKERLLVPAQKANSG